MAEIDAAIAFRDQHLEGYEEKVARYHGPFYNRRGDYTDEYSPENTYYEYISLMVPRLVYDNPRVQVQTRRPGVPARRRHRHAARSEPLGARLRAPHGADRGRDRHAARVWRVLGAPGPPRQARYGARNRRAAPRAGHPVAHLRAYRPSPVLHGPADGALGRLPLLRAHVAHRQGGSGRSGAQPSLRGLEHRGDRAAYLRWQPQRQVRVRLQGRSEPRGGLLLRDLRA